MSQIRAIRPTTQEMEYTNHPLYYEKCIKIKASIVENFTPFDQKWKKNSQRYKTNKCYRLIAASA